MKEFLGRLKNKSGSKIHSFYLEFNQDPDDIFLTRGAKDSNPISFGEFLLQDKIRDLKQFLKKR